MMPRCSSRRWVAGPMPQILPIARGDSTASIPRAVGGMTVRPSGFSKSEASFARNLLGATPTDATNPVAAKIASFSCLATTSAGPMSRSVPVMSRNASSTLSGCTNGEKSSSTANIARDFSRIRCPGTFTHTACGHRRSASAIGIAERQPNSRAS